MSEGPDVLLRIGGQEWRGRAAVKELWLIALCGAGAAICVLVIGVIFL
jgi:hypothetical protein